VYSARPSQLAADQLVPISARTADDALWLALDRRRAELAANGLLSLQRIGDCRAPGMIAAAVYAGHRAARELGCEQVEFKRDRVVV
jgi:dimethylamine/trimethylamine dehydrogenase